MDISTIKNSVQNFHNSSLEEIRDVLYFIADLYKSKYKFDFIFEIVYDEGGCVKSERSPEGLQQVEIGYSNLALLKMDKYLGLPIDTTEERKEFIELILQTFHELKHLMQNYFIYDNPKATEKNLLLTRERIIDFTFLGFRLSNYEQSLFEVDAMRYSLIKASEFFKEMGLDISEDEVFSVMKEKELIYCDYDLKDFGDSFDSAIKYFDSIFNQIKEIKNIDKIIGEMLESIDDKDKKEISPLIENFKEETDIERKLDILQEISLILHPELKESYPLVNIYLENKTGVAL